MKGKEAIILIVHRGPYSAPFVVGAYSTQAKADKEWEKKKYNSYRGFGSWGEFRRLKIDGKPRDILGRES